MRASLVQQLQQTVRRSTAASPSSSSLPSQLLELAVPLIPSHGFTVKTLSLASLLLPPPHTPSHSLPASTINALFPSPPPRTPSAFSTGRSLSREEIIADARAAEAGEEDLEGRQKERVGPAKALVEAWLLEGRKKMVGKVKELGWKDERGLKEGLRERIRWNEDVGDMLPDALALLGASTTSPLSQISLTSLLPVPSPLGVMEHVALIAHDLAAATGDESQGVSWYATRARIGTLYGLVEMHLVSPTLASLTPEERTISAFALLDRLLQADQSVAGVKQYGEFIVKSWGGMARSLGVGI